MCSTSDDVLLTKVSLSETKAHHLLSVIKQEPQDYDVCNQNSFRPGGGVAPMEPQRKILPSMATSPFGSTNTATSVPPSSVYHPRHVSTITTDSQAARVASQISPSSMINLASLPTTTIHQTHPGLSNNNPLPVAHSVSAATFLPHHPSVAAPNFTTIAPLLVSSLIPSNTRKPAEHHQSQQHQQHQQLISSSLPTLINSTTQAAYGLFNACTLTEHGFIPSSHPSYPTAAPHTQSQSISAHANPRLSVFAQLVPRGHFPSPVVCTTSISHNNSQPFLPAFTGSPTRSRFPASYGHPAWSSSSPTTILPKMAVASSLPPMTTTTMTITGVNTVIPPAPQYPIKGTHWRHPNAPVYEMNGSVATQTSSVSCTNVGIGQTQVGSVRTTTNSTSESACQTMVDAANLTNSTGTVPPTRTSTGVNTQLSEKIQSIDPVITTSTGTVTSQPAPSPNTASAETANLGDTLVWGRVVRMPDGDVQFPGLGKLIFSSPQAVLRQIRRIASSEESLSLQLPPSTLEFELPEDSQINNWLAPTSTECGSRKGFHVCLCCHQAFTSRALYDSHMMRPVARILYRCHLCRGTEPAYLSTAAITSMTGTVTSTTTTTTTAANGMAHGSAVSDTNAGLDDPNSVIPTDVECSSGCSFRSPYCTVLPGGIIKAPNRCAIYSHMACVHPHQVDQWALLPSLLTICPLSESAWSIPSFRLNHRLGLSEPPHTITPVATIPSTVLENSGFTNEPGQPVGPGLASVSFPFTPGQKTGEDAIHQGASGIVPAVDSASNVVTAGAGIAATESLDLATFYQPGMELTELWCDLERAMCEAVSHQSLNFLSTFTNPIGLRQSSLGLSEPTLSSWFGSLNASFTRDQRGSSSRCPLNRLLVRSDDAGGSTPPLPDSDSALAQTILLSACVDNWKSHLFLTAWCQRCDRGPEPTPGQQTNASAPIVIEDDNADIRASPPSNGMRASAQSSTSRNSEAEPPPAPSISELYESLNQLEKLRVHASPNANNTDSAPSESDTRTVQSTDGVLRCLICQFRATSPKQLQLHLSGAQPYTLTKCAICGQSVCIRQPNLCAVKAHLLLHLDCFLMCPQCGFTPPAHLAPDATELCLRIHLRFVCFHYNVLQVYLCTRCQGQGKAFHSLTHLSQHFFDRHTTRMYACMWCARQAPSMTGTSRSLTPPSRPDGVSVTRHGTSDESTTGADRSDGHRTPDSSFIPVTDRARTPERIGTPPTKPVYSFLSARELLTHLRAQHRHVLTVPTSSVTPSTGNTIASTSTTTSTTSAMTTSAILAIPNTTVSNAAATTNRSNLECEAVLDNPRPVIEQSSTRDSVPERDGDSERPGSHSADSFASTDKGVSSVELPNASRFGDANNPPFCLVPMVDFTCGYKCPECNQAFDNRDSFGHHFRVSHPWSFTAVCCYRCFGSCKRLSFNLDDFRRHTSVCPSARRMLLRTFAASSRENDRSDAIESRSRMPSSSDCRKESTVPSCTITTTSTAPVRNRPTSGFGPSKHPLCFCSHCGIGTRRVDPPGTNAGGPSESPADLVIDEHYPDVAPDNRTSSEPSTLTIATPGTKEPTHDACYFPDLAALHAHESQWHASENSSQIACPWCGYRLSCFKRQDLNWTLHHLRSHLLRHNFASWNLERKRRWNKNVEDLPHCSCGSALLDSPLALASHGSVHLLACNPLLPRLSNDNTGGGPSTLQAESLASAPRNHPTSLDTNGVASGSTLSNDIEHPKPPMARSNHISRQTNINRPLLRPGSGAHIPCSVDVYRHLRFGIFPELDHYLSCATLSNQPFLCPVCNCSLSTRWALTEHAFVEHWGSVCFICCIHLVPGPSRVGADVARHADTTSHAAVPSSSSVLTETSESPRASSQPLADVAPTSQADTNTNNMSATVSVPPVSGEADSNTEHVHENFWSHVYQCMEKRRQDLKQAQLCDDAEECCTTTNPVPDAVQPAVDEAAACHETNERPVASDCTLQAPWNSIPISDSVTNHSTAPIVILSSPDTLASSDNEQLTPHSGLGGPGSYGERSCGGDSDHTLPCLNSGDSINSHSLCSDAALGAASHDALVVSRSNGDSSRRTKRRRLTLERYGASPMSSHWSEASDARTVDEDSSCSRICVLCGTPQTPDTWEEHQMSHRNPHMLWNGLQLADPSRIVLSPRQTKIYRCYICNARFVSRFSCRRHMGELHKLDKSQLNWDLLSESGASVLPSSGSSMQNVYLQSKTSKGANSVDPNRPRSACNPPSEQIESSESSGQASSRPLTRVHSPSRPTRLKIPSARLTPIHSHSKHGTTTSAPPAKDDSRTCILCAIQFMSSRSLAIHKLAAHGLSD